MKKIILSALVGIMYVGSASAAPNNVGCGWGSMILKARVVRSTQPWRRPPMEHLVIKPLVFLPVPPVAPLMA